VASEQMPVAAKQHPTEDHGPLATLSRFWMTHSSQIVFGIGMVIVGAAIIVSTRLPVSAVLRDVLAGIWTTPDVLVIVAISLALIAIVAGMAWPTTYLPTLWAVAPLIPGLAAISVVATYLIAPRDAGPAAFIVGSEVAATIAIIGTIPLRMLATVRVAQTRSYWELRRRSEQLRKRLNVVEHDVPHAGWSTSQQMALDEANKQLNEVKRALLRPASRSRTNGLEWVSAMGYVSLWRRVDRAEEALIDLEPREALLGDALHDKLRLSGAGIKRDQLEGALAAAVHVIDPHGFDRYFAPTMQEAKVDATTVVGQPAPAAELSSPAPTEQADEPLARAVLREVRHALNTFTQDAMEGIVRARNRLWRAITLTATTTFLLVGMAVLSNVPKPQLIAASVFFLVAAVVGLFNLLRAQANADSGVEDFNLFEARLVHTPLISGLAGIAGVVLVSVTPYLTGTAPTQSEGQTLLTSMFNLDTNHAGLLVAAAFGLAPERIIGPLQDQTEKLKGQVKAGKAAVEAAPEASESLPG
jgi:hypothetical protein